MGESKRAEMLKRFLVLSVFIFQSHIVPTNVTVRLIYNSTEEVQKTRKFNTLLGTLLPTFTGFQK